MQSTAHRCQMHTKKRQSVGIAHLGSGLLKACIAYISTNSTKPHVLPSRELKMLIVIGLLVKHNDMSVFVIGRHQTILVLFNIGTATIIFKKIED
uniref:Uncharacterized protein n=1 Tax=Rhipicephalus zambeziensis TaxID=60191 RepID=A0A224YGF2_9ACAR